REREFAMPVGFHNLRLLLRIVPTAQRPLDPECEVMKSRRFKQLSQSHSHSHLSAHTSHYLRRQQRMAAQLEEVLSRSHFLEPQYFSPHSVHQPFDLSPASNPSATAPLFCFTRLPHHHRQGTGIDLPARRQRQ